MLRICTALFAVLVLSNCIQAQNLTPPVGIGTTSPRFMLHVVNTNTLGLGVQSTETLSPSSGAFIRLYGSNVPTAANQRLGGVLMGVLPATGSVNTGTQIEGVSEAGWTEGSSHPSALKFLTVPSGSTIVTERMRITATGYVGIGTTTPGARLHVATAQETYPILTTYAKFTQTNVADTNAHLSIVNNTSIPGMYIPGITGRGYIPGRPYGICFIGESEDVVPADYDAHSAAIMLDGRSKAKTKLVNNNVLAVNSASQNLLMVKADGSVAINTTDTKGYKLAVGGSMIAERIKVKLKGSWPDYVFQPGYDLPALTALEKYVRENEHLPGIPTATEVEKDGLDLSEMNRKLLQKIEELTLYLIDQDKQFTKQRMEMAEKIHQLEERLSSVEKK